MNFINYSMQSAEEYKESIKESKHEKTEKEAWKKAENVIAYSESMVSDDDKEIYFEFVDDKLNFYVEFFNIKTKEWIESYKFKDEYMGWTAFIDNIYYGNPLKIDESKTFRDILKEN